MATGIRELRLWQEAVALGGEVARAVHQCSRRETRQVTDQILHTSLVIAARIAEGYERATPEEQITLYRAARVALSILDTELAIARHAGLLPSTTLGQLTTRSAAVGKLLSGYLGLLARQSPRETADAPRANPSPPTSPPPEPPLATLPSSTAARPLVR
ncbi:MAG TPA: four helix bundle protein [Gemmatimonadaceae bacterium]|nr:four helix bundle protein [Gemmatimonadaceae bacterium]